MSGILYGIGVGAGSADELTLKGLETIKNCSVLIFPNNSKDECRAYQIVKENLPEVEAKKLIFCDFPMTKDKNALMSAWENAAKQICKELKKKSVAFLTIGDATIYSTFFYIKSLVEKEGFKTDVISGIPSFCAVAAKLGMSLALDSEQIHIIPDADDLEKVFALSGTLIFMKIGRKLGALKEFLIKNQGKILVFGAVSNCGFPEEKIYRTPQDLDETQYLTVVIVKTTNVPASETQSENDFSYKFFQNRACKNFPCHKNVPENEFNCLFCYCPLYALGKTCGGNFKYTAKGIKSCIDCNFPHIRENYEKITKRFAEISAISK